MYCIINEPTYNNASAVHHCAKVTYRQPTLSVRIILSALHGRGGVNYYTMLLRIPYTVTALRMHASRKKNNYKVTFGRNEKADNTFQANTKEI